MKQYNKKSEDYKKGIYARYFKRVQDIVCATFALIILSPVLLVTATLVRIKLGKPILFKQKRPGLNEKIFTLYKFRTMTDERNAEGKLLPDDVRLTPFGRMLRKTSLDELPELWNILIGSMTIVGPRPQLVRDMVFMTEVQRKRHTVKPGLTGLAQVSGRNAILWEDKLSYDLQYVERITFLEDWKIIFRTIRNVFKREGINTEGMATAEDFGDYLLGKGKIEKDLYDRLQVEAKQILESSGKL